MMHPMRVEWTTPDENRRALARSCMENDLRNRHDGLGAYDLIKIAALPEPERSEALARRYPDLTAETVHFGTMLSIRYVPEQWGLRTFARGGLDLGTTGAERIRLSESKWVALVATARGTVEMNPLKLRVMWPSSAGDPIAGIVTADELARRAAEEANGGW